MKKWFKEWAEPKFTRPVGGNVSAKTFISADCFQLRCSLIHSGSAEIAAKKRDILSRFVFFDQTTGMHLTWVEGMTVNGVRQENYLQLRADLFSEAMFEAADAWDTAKAGDANVEKEKAKHFL
jgi:hypothetical protein